jgi:hypothetical protein
MKEMDHPTTVRNIDPALYKRGVAFAVAVFDDPVAQTVLTDEIRVETSHPILNARETPHCCFPARNRR